MIIDLNDENHLFWKKTYNVFLLDILLEINHKILLQLAQERFT